MHTVCIMPAAAIKARTPGHSACFFLPLPESRGLQGLLKVELLSKPLSIARQEAKFTQVADIHDINAVLAVCKLNNGPACQMFTFGGM